MKLKKNTFIRAYAYFKDQLALAKEKEDNEDVVKYYNRQIDTLMTRYYSQ